MNYKKPRRTGQQRESREVVKPLMDRLRLNGFWVKKLHGSKYQSGLPDLLAIHPYYGTMFIECKVEGTGKLSPSQIRSFKDMTTYGARIFVIDNPDDWEVVKGKPNWNTYAVKQYTRAKNLKLPRGF